MLNATDQLMAAKQYAAMVVAYKNGAAIRVSDLGDVIDGPEDMHQAAWLQREPAIVLDIHKQPGFNVVQVRMAPSGSVARNMT